MKAGFNIIFICFLSLTKLASQDEICGFERLLSNTIIQEFKKTDLIESSKDMNYQSKQDYIESRSAIIIPTIVHVIWKDSEDNISTERILEQLQMLNDVFSNNHPDLQYVPEEFRSVIGNPSLQFCLVSKDSTGLPTSGIIRRQTNIDKIGATDNLFFTELGGSTAWDTKKYFNIWITGIFGNTGFGIPPWLATPSKDGIVLRSRVVDVGNPENREGNGRVCVHEIGHYFGLSHLWGNDQRLDTACLVDDGLSDTPPQFRATQDCPDENHLPPFSCGNYNMYVNFMDYSPDQCLSMFTQQQVDLMLNVLNTSRAGLKNNNTACHNFPDDDYKLNFRLYPNPTSSRVKLFFETDISIYSTIELYNLEGILIWTQEDLLYDGFEITIPKVPSGIYIIKIGNEIQKLTII